MTDKKEPLDISDVDAAPVPEEDGAGPDNALKVLQSPVKQDSDARDDAGLRDKIQSPVEQDSDAHIDVGLQDKLQSPAEQVPVKDTKWMKGLAPEVTRRIQRLQEIQSRKNELDEEINTLQVEYEHALESLCTERSKIVNGEVDLGSNTYETAEEATSDEKATKVKGIPEFWLTAMKNIEVLASKITRGDEEALKYLKDIKCCTFGDQLELKLDFYFDNNPYFENSILTRICKEIGEPSIGTEIDWLPGKCLTEEGDSFFLFFECADANFTDDDDIRDIFINVIIPNAASWYTGKALEEDYDESESSETDSDDDYDSDDYSDETDSDDYSDYSDETKISEEEDEYVDEKEGDGEANNKVGKLNTNFILFIFCFCLHVVMVPRSLSLCASIDMVKRTRGVEGPTARKRRLIR